MDRLILLRHGKAEADAPSGQDYDRGLTGRGRRDAAIVARALAEADLSPDLVLVSPAARAAQTWEAAAPAFPRARVRRAPALYEADPASILQIAQDEGREAGVVMVIGHNPGLAYLAARLAQECAHASSEVKDELRDGFPTAAAAVIAFGEGTARLFLPKKLGGGR